MRGFTLIEMLVSITIAAILFAIVLLGFSSLRDETGLSIATDDAVSFLQEARAKTLSSNGASAYGVHFETAKFVLFTGDTYDALDPTNEDRTLPAGLEISVISLNGGGADVVFKRLTGETDEYGNVTIRIVDTPSTTRVINVTSTGFSTIQ